MSHSHAPHPDCPDTLSCLPNSEGRPQHTLPVILRCAILGSPKKRLTIREIYAAMEEKYPYYKTAGPTWKQSVRHHLSLNRLFERQPRPVTDPGFGSYWTVNLSAPPGTKRPRKRGRAQKTTTDGQTSPGKKRGRPRKTPEVDSPILPPFATLALQSDPSPRTCQLSAVRTSGGRFEDEDELMAYDFETERQTEDDSEGEYDFGPGGSIIQGFPSGHKSVIPSTASALGLETAGAMIDRLRMEMEGLRKQSTDAVSVSLRMSDQLAQAQSEASRAKAALKTTENMLEDESKKRREAERLADEEAAMRRAAEEALTRIRREWTPMRAP
ncbi:hypothetical protein JAAARDRAFT_53352 [Jaapia argillacea MUCL 33604]|uniref:Fork-head domain-containing protein n=1 Tax=Jaapia argillacea MUCL 33604 TaxID=933084 RepID=A0A067Q828_9AGAM|nr:hypothetical protein JAAARDRAFT_53352 [Jaapia argillacea MUCL 33604]